MADFKVDVPRASVRRVARSSHRTGGTIGVHARGGSWLANGSADGLVEIEIDPPCHTERSLSTLFRRMKVSELIVSLVDPDGFITAVQRDGVHPRTGSREE
jgi:predicted metal-dependent phosphotriesterase family hydrolase